jgi:hypothetical protein
MENRRRMPSDGIAFGKVSKTKKKIFFLHFSHFLISLMAIQYM